MSKIRRRHDMRGNVGGINWNCRSKKKRMAKHIGLIRWNAIICVGLPHLDTEQYRTMKNKAVCNFEESNHGTFVSGQFVTVFEYIKIKVWIIDCHFYTITAPKCICGVRLWTGLECNLLEGRELNHWFVILGFPKHIFIIQEFGNTRMVGIINANFSVFLTWQSSIIRTIRYRSSSAIIFLGWSTKNHQQIRHPVICLLQSTTSITSTYLLFVLFLPLSLQALLTRKQYSRGLISTWACIHNSKYGC